MGAASLLCLETLSSIRHLFSTLTVLLSPLLWFFFWVFIWTAVDLYRQSPFAAKWSFSNCYFMPIGIYTYVQSIQCYLYVGFQCWPFGMGQPTGVLFPGEDDVSFGSLPQLSRVLSVGLRPCVLLSIQFALFLGVFLVRVIFGQSCL